MHVVPAWRIVTVCPPMVRSVERATADEVLEPMVTPTVPLPVPEGGLTEAQSASLDAVHEQLEPFVVMATRPAPPRGP